MTLNINSIFILISTVGLLSCGRTSSEQRFEKALDISIPDDSEVVKDEYQDMIQDYVIYYNIKLTNAQLKQISSSIQNSRYFNSSEDEFGIWHKTDYGFEFLSNSIDKTEFRATLDTSKQTMEFIESAD